MEAEDGGDGRVRRKVAYITPPFVPWKGRGAGGILAKCVCAVGKWGINDAAALVHSTRAVTLAPPSPQTYVNL